MTSRNPQITTDQTR